MGLGAAEHRPGTLVWVHRKNGTWWPGRVCHVRRRRKGQEPNASVELLTVPSHYQTHLGWFNLEKSKCIKAFRCGEFNDCIRKVESNQSQYPKETIKYDRREDAIRLALHLEDQMRKKRKEIGEEQEEIVHRGKRSRRVYLPAADTLMSTVLSSLSKYNEEATNTEQNPGTKDSSKLSPRHVTPAKLWAQEEKVEREQILKPETKTMRKMSPNSIDTALVDVHVTFQVNSEEKHVPLVSIMSKFSSKAIVGYPVRIERSSGCIPMTYGIATSLKLTWKKKRTPVSYGSQDSQPLPLLGTNNIKKDKDHHSNGPLVVSCVPVPKIFSDLFRAVGKV